MPAPVSQQQTWVGDSGYEMVWVEPGSFMMGSPSSEPDRGDDEVQHRVELTEGFYVGMFEVTQGLWSSVMGSNPSFFNSCGSTCPVEQVSWCDAVIFANELSRRDGLTPTYLLPPDFSASMSYDACRSKSGLVSWDRSADGYRLLTESEWEYSARAGGTHRYAGSDDVNSVAWYSSNNGDSTHPVGQKSPNAWGFTT